MMDIEHAQMMASSKTKQLELELHLEEMKLCHLEVEKSIGDKK